MANPMTETKFALVNNAVVDLEQKMDLTHMEKSGEKVH